MPKFSVLCSTFRCGGLDILFAGLRDQTFKDFEIILADRRYELRHKEVMELAKEYGLNVIHVPEWKTNGKWTSFCNGWNTAIAVARGEYVFFCQDWQYLMPTVLQEHLERHSKPNRYVISGYIYTDLPLIKKSIYIDPEKQMERGSRCTEEDEIQKGGIIDEVCCFADGKFSSDWLPDLRHHEHPHQDQRHVGLYTPVSVESCWAHVKCESVLRDTLLKINGLDERMERGKGPMDIELGNRFMKAGITLYFDPTITKSIAPNVRWVIRTRPWGSMDERLEGRWSYNDGLDYIRRRSEEIDNATSIEEKKKLLKAKNTYDINQLSQMLGPWRDESNHPVKSQDVDDLTYWGREIWPESE